MSAAEASERRSVESHAHRQAKILLAGWLREAAAAVGHDEYAVFPMATPLHCSECADGSPCRRPACDPRCISWRVNRPAPGWGVWIEYPVLADNKGIMPVWDEIDPDAWAAGPPTYDELILSGRHPACVLDIAVQHKGQIVYAVEVVHKHRCALRKIRVPERSACNHHRKSPPIGCSAKSTAHNGFPPNSSFKPGRLCLMPLYRPSR